MRSKSYKSVPGKIALGGVEFDAVTEREVCAHILEKLSNAEGGCVVTANLDHLLRCQRDPSYLDLVRQAELVVADGMPLIWASRLQGTRLPERVAGSTLCLTLAEELAKARRSLYLLGGDPGVASQAAVVLQQLFPGLRIAGDFCPPFGFEQDPEAMKLIRDRLRAAQPDVVFVALGSPKQERLIAQLRGELGEVWWLGVGISLSFITGDVQRAPVWVQRMGLEWIHRLVQEPRRLFRRYLIDGIPFAGWLLLSSCVRRLSRDRHPVP